MNPILSIILAVLITVIFIVICAVLGIYIHGFDFVIFILMFLCGGIVTWFSTENKVIYSLYYGVIIILFLLTLGSITSLNNIVLITLLIPALFGGFVAKNEKNGGLKNLLDNKFRFEYNVFILSFFKRNKLFLIASMVIFLVSFFIGAVGPFLNDTINHYIIDLWASYIPNTVDGFNIISIFIQNGSFALIDFYFGGIFLGILSTMHLVLYGFVEGFALVNNPIYFIYGIFRDLGFIIATAAGFKLLCTTINIIKNMLHIERNKPKIMQISQILDANYMKFRDSVILFSISIIVIFIAAIIEFYILQ